MSKQYVLLVTAKYNDTEDLYIFRNPFHQNNLYFIREREKFKITKCKLPPDEGVYFINSILTLSIYVRLNPHIYKRKTETQDDIYGLRIFSGYKVRLDDLEGASINIRIIDEQELESHMSRFIQRYVPSFMNMYDYVHFNTGDKRVNLFVDNINNKVIFFGKEVNSREHVMKEIEMSPESKINFDAESITYEIETLKPYRLEGEAKKVGTMLGSEIINKILAL